MADLLTAQFTAGVHNLLDDENIPQDAYKDALNWLTNAGSIELSRGKVLIGPEGPQGEVRAQWFGYRADGTKVQYRLTGGTIQYLNVSLNTWVTIVSGLNATDDYTFANYSSLAGNFTFATGPGGLFKFHNANPGSYINMYASGTNFLGKCLIDKARMLMYNLPTDKTGLYGSHIDPQSSVVYTTVTNEVLGTGNGVTTTFSGTLAFKGSNALANAFGLLLNMNPSGITAIDDYNGIISGTGVTGTINYVTGAWTLTFASAVAGGTQIRVTYQWENSNVKGLTDFTKSSPRVASEGFVVRQDEGGDAIQKVLLGLDDAYYSVKKYSVYRFVMDATDLNPTNDVYRKDIGIAYWQSAVATGKGIVFMNTANPDKPELTRLEKNPLGDNIEPNVLLPQFKWENYAYDEAIMETLGRYLLIVCKQIGSLSNDRLLLCDLSANTVDITGFGMKSIGKDGATLYGGSPYTQSVYQIFSGFDDDGYVIDNFVELKGETYKSERLKKFRRLRLQGRISQQQSYEVYISYDDQDYQLVGTVLGTGTYVDSNAPATVGTQLVGDEAVGGESLTDSDVVYPYFLEMKVKCPKFRKRSIRFVALGFGYCSIKQTMDWDILSFEQRMPKRYRLKQNVSLDGENTDVTPPEF